MVSVSGVSILSTMASSAVHRRQTIVGISPRGAGSDVEVNANSEEMVVRRAVPASGRAVVASRRSDGTAPRFGTRRDFQRTALALSLLAGIPVTPRTASAQVELAWQAPPACPRHDEVLERVRAIAGAALDEADRLSVKATIIRKRGQFQIELLVRDGRKLRHRTIASTSCATLAEAAAVTLALLLGADVAPSARATAPASEPASGTQPSSSGGGESPRAEQNADSRATRDTPREELPDQERATVPQPADRVESVAPRHWALALRVPVVAADVGLLPRPMLGIGLGLGLRYDAWGLFALGYLYRERSLTAVDSGRSFGAELQRASGELVGCHAWRWSQFEIAPCGGLALELITVRGFGEGVAPRKQRTVVPALVAGVVAHWYVLRSLAIFGGLSGYLELARPRVVIRELGQVEQLAPAALGATLGVEWIL
jgi:hypothetical protein